MKLTSDFLDNESKIQTTLDFYSYQFSRQIVPSKIWISKIFTKKFQKFFESPRILFFFFALHPRFSRYNDWKKKLRDN